MTSNSKWRCLVQAVVAALAVASMTACDGRTDGGTAEDVPGGEARLSESEKSLLMRLSPLGTPAPDETNHVVDDERAVRLGQFLFFDQRLSKNGQVSCATCHKPEQAFSSAEALSQGLDETRRHPPTLLNAAFHRWYNWDGSTDSLWAQAVGPLENPKEMGFTRAGLVHLIAEDAELRAAYEAIFGALPDLEGIPAEARPVMASSAKSTSEDPSKGDHPHQAAWDAMDPDDQVAVNQVLTNVTKALAAYQTELVQADAPFDTFVEGLREDDPKKRDALSLAARRGAKLFLGRANCVSCHTGPNFSDGSFHNLGLGPRDWLVERDEGRWDAVPLVKKSEFNAAGAYSDDPDGERARWNTFLRRTAEDHGQFKTPSLRNVALSAPYMHGGHFETLEEVVRFYATLSERSGVGHREEMLAPLALSERDVDDLVAFLHSLTGRPLDPQLTHPPATPSMAPVAKKP